MKPHSHATRVAFHRAVWASVVLHIAVVGTLFALFALFRTSEEKSRESGIDTSVPYVRMSFTEERDPALLPATVAPATVEPVAKPVNGSTGLATGTTPAQSSITPAPIQDANVQPASGSTTATTTATAIHGALQPGQTVVYVLDASGSMGAAGRFDTARAALIATLREQPEMVRFQVIVYDGTARTPLPSNGIALPVTDANIRAVSARLATVEPRGRSNHLVGVRAALGFRPDAILLLTDAGDLTAASLQPVLVSATKPALVCVGLVSAEGVQPPRELK